MRTGYQKRDTARTYGGTSIEGSRIMNYAAFIFMLKRALRTYLLTLTVGHHSPLVYRGVDRPPVHSQVRTEAQQDYNLGTGYTSRWYWYEA